MANENLNNSIELRGGRLDSTVFPPGSEITFIEALVNRSDDVVNVANKAQEAASGAYEAQITNDQQDLVLANHEQRIGDLEVTVADHEIRITSNTNAISALTIRVTTAEGSIVTLQANVTNLQGRMTTAETNITNLQSSVSAIQGDYVSKSVVTSQTLASPLNVATSYSVGGTKVVGVRNTGWTASTGGASKAGINGSTAYTVGAAYSQTEVQAIATGLQQVRQAYVALQTAMAGHGLINA